MSGIDLIELSSMGTCSQGRAGRQSRPPAPLLPPNPAREEASCLGWHLRFHGELERSFQEEYRVNTLPTTRRAFVLGLVLYAAFGALDVVAMPLSKNTIWLIRYAVVCPFFVFVLIATGLPVFVRHLQRILFLGVTVAGLGIVAMIAVSHKSERGYWFYTSGLLLVVMFAYGFSRLQFWYTVAANLIIVAAYECVELGHIQALASREGTETFIIQNFFFLSANIIGVFTGYALEAHARREFLQKRAIETEKEKSERLLRNILPEKIAGALKQYDRTIADEFQETSVLFADVANFTQLDNQLSPTAVVGLLNDLFSQFDALVDRYGVEKIKTIGDCYMVAAGVPDPRPDHARVLADLALDMLDYVHRHRFAHGRQLNLRIGINSGPLVAGVVGRKKFIYDLWGETVNTASRMESHGAVGRIQITQSTYERLNGAFRCEAAGVIQVKGKGPMEVWHLVGRNEGHRRETAEIAATGDEVPPAPCSVESGLARFSPGNEDG